MWCDMIKNDNVDEFEDCDVSNEVIDFSLQNNAADTFAKLLEYDEEDFSQQLKHKIWKYIAWTSGGLVVTTSFSIILLSYSIKFIGDNQNIQDFIKPHIQKILNVNDIKIKSGNMSFKGIKPFILLRGVNVNGLEIPELKITPAIFKSIFSFRFRIGEIELVNANIDLAVSNKTENIFMKNYFSNEKDAKYIPVDSINNAFTDDIECKISKSSIKIRRGNESLSLDDVSGAFSGRKLIPDSMSFKTRFSHDAPLSTINVTNNAHVIDVKFKDIKTNDINKFIKEKELQFLKPILKVTENGRLNLYGSLSFEKKNQNIKFDISSGEGTIFPKFITSFIANGKYVDKVSIAGVCKNDAIILNDVDLYFQKSHLKVTNLSVDKDGYSVDGTLAMRNISKRDLLLIPKPITDSCLFLFKHNIPDFKLASLKMDVKGSVSYSGKNPDMKFDISHGKFEMRDGAIQLANKIIENASASGEIIGDKVKLNIRSANLCGMTVDGGTLNINNNGESWDGTISTVLPTASFIQQLNILKQCAVPFDKFVLKDKVKCKLCVVSNKDNNNNGFKIISGEGSVLSGNHMLFITWDADKATIRGLAETKAKRIVSLNTSIDIKNNVGEKQLVIDSDNDMVASINESVAAILKGKYKVTTLEKWSGNKGSYKMDIDLNGATISLPAIGNIKNKDDPGHISATATFDGNMMVFDKVNIDAKDKHITGSMTIDRSTNAIVSCNFKDVSSRNSHMTLNIRHTEEGPVKVNIVGSYLDISNMLEMIKNEKSDSEIVISTRIDKARISDFQTVRDLKGRITIKNGSIIDGAGYCVLLDGSTVVLDASMLDEANIITLSASNAGQFLKELDFTDSVVGGRLKLSIASDLSELSANNIQAINCELSDILVKNNEQFAKLASLSMTNNVDPKNFSVGFNGVICSLSIVDGHVTISDGRAIGPMICLSFNGTYDRMDDDLKLSGIAVPVNFYALNGKSIYSPYSLFGSLSHLDLAVNPLCSTEKNLLADVFGVDVFDYSNNVTRSNAVANQHILVRNNNLPTYNPMPVASNIGVAKKTSGYVEEEFNRTPVDLDQVKKIAKAVISKKKPAPVKKQQTVDKNFGITVTRGL